MFSQTRALAFALALGLSVIRMLMNSMYNPVDECTECNECYRPFSVIDIAGHVVTITCH